MFQLSLKTFLLLWGFIFTGHTTPDEESRGLEKSHHIVSSTGSFADWEQHKQNLKILPAKLEDPTLSKIKELTEREKNPTLLFPNASNCIPPSQQIFSPKGHALPKKKHPEHAQQKERIKDALKEARVYNAYEEAGFKLKNVKNPVAFTEICRILKLYNNKSLTPNFWNQAIGK